MAVVKHVEYQCTWCGKRVVKIEGKGRPEPGRCPRKDGDKPHTWTVSKKY